MADEGRRAVVVEGHDGLPVGIVSERDLVVRALAWQLAPDTPVDTVMTPDLVTAEASAPAAAVYRSLRQHAIRQIPLLENGKVVALLRLEDLDDEMATELLATRRRCPHCQGDWLRPVATAEATNFLCLQCHACWHLESGEFVRVDQHACPGCPDHNFCRVPLVDRGVDW
jgi:CBS-domain-containing membrane protein